METISLDTSSVVASCKKEIRNEYLKEHKYPWVIAFSGGKDSTLLAQLTLEVLLDLPPHQRTRPIHLIYNDTLVESPVFQDYVTKQLKRIEEGVQALRLPVTVTVTSPPMTETFWFNLLGKGYPAPNRSFRWCMDRLKIEPSSNFIKQKIAESGQVILLLGVRKAESIARATRIEKYSAENDYARLVPNTEINDCWIFRPVMDMSTEQVWDYVRNSTPPWGSSNISLLEMYTDAGMCNATQSCALMDEDAVPDSKSILARFGCWTCTVVRQDKSLEALVDSGYKELKHLVAFRERIRSVSDTPAYRSKTRRNGQPGLGPLTFEARELLLNELIETEKKVGNKIISEHEIRLIREQWVVDKTEDQIRSLKKKIN